ncbi:MAG: hypothetical protein FJ291_04455 [Planctomycetes bacterium]|nr:hypothetical protein [Planctomycetota bacterium]
MGNGEVREALAAPRGARDPFGEDGAPALAGVREAFSLRALAVGSLMCLFIGVASPYNLHKIHGSYMDIDFSTPAAFFLFFVLVFMLNGVLRWVGLALNAGELLVVYVMMIVATTIPSMGMTASFIPDIAAEYFASPENGWDTLIVPHLPSWVRPTDSLAVKWLFEGMPRGETIPWGAWVVPLAMWLSFLFALYFTMIAVMVIVRRQWVERERLVYPMVQLPIEMVKAEEKPGFTNPVLRSGWLWAGILIPALVVSYNGLNFYFPASVPEKLVLGTRLDIFRGAARLQLNISFPMAGFAYMLRLDMALSLWVFSLITQIERGLFKMLGFDGFVTAQGFVRHLDGYSQNGGGPLVCHQSLGALLALVAIGLWLSRGHLRNVAAKAFGRGKDVDDSDEVMSYPFAFWGTAICVVYMAAWLWRSGMSPGIAVAMVVLSLATFYGITRVVAGGGLAAARAPVISSTAVISALGSDGMPPSTMVAFGLSYVWMSDVRIFVMASAANGLKLGSELPGRRRRLFWAMAIAVVVALLSSIWMTMRIAYTEGGANANDWFFRGGPQYPYTFLGTAMNNPSGPDFDALLFTGFGAAVMSVLTILHHRFVWWPLHPMGLPLSTIMMTDFMWASILIAWAVKLLVLSYGGAKLYRKTRLFFLGLILGQFTACGAWIIVDFFTGRVGNNLYWV